MDQTILKKLGFDQNNKNILSDMEVSITYANALEILHDLKLHLYNNLQLDKDQCLAFFCKNQVIDLLLLTVLISEKQRFILLNGNNALMRESELKRLNHCSFYLVTEKINPNFEFDDSIELLPNKYFTYLESNVIKEGTILFKSSGSSGESKVVVHEFENLMNNCLACANHLELNFNDKIAIPVPINHMYGFGAALLPSLMKGVSLILINNTNVPAYLDAERLFKPNITFLTPGILEMYVKFKRSQYDYRYVITAGDVLNKNTASIINKKFGKVVNLYGSTELGVIATSKDVDKDDHELLLPLPKVEISSNKLSENYKELICSHPFPFSGYFDVKEQTLKKNTGNSFNTHDLVIEKEDLRFKLNGRKNFCINRSGVLVSLTEIEKQIKDNIAEIHDIVVLESSVSNNQFKGVDIHALFVFDNVQKISNNELKIRCKSFLENYKIPDSFIELDFIPALPSGKPDRQKLYQNIINLN